LDVGALHGRPVNRELALGAEGDVTIVDLLDERHHDRPRAGRAEYAQCPLPTLEPAREDDVSQVTDVVVVVVGDEYRIDSVDRDAGSRELKDDTAPGVEQEVLAVDLEDGSRPVTGRVRYRATGAEKRESHPSCLDRGRVLPCQGCRRKGRPRRMA